MGNCLIRRRKSVGSEREYIGQLIPRRDYSTNNVSASSQSTVFGDWLAWMAFNGVYCSDLRNPKSVWCSNEGDTNPWIQYHFDEARYFESIRIDCFSNYSGNFTGDIKIEGSTNGVNFKNLLIDSTTVSITANLQQVTEITIPLNSKKMYNYIRLTGTSAFNVPYYPSLMIDEIYVYGGKAV